MGFTEKTKFMLLGAVVLGTGILIGAKLRGAKMIGILSNYETLLPEVILDKRPKKETRE